MMAESLPLVLCVAEKQLSLSVRCLILETEGYRVISASTPEDALRLCLSRQPDVIVCEQPLGNGSGIELAETLKQLHPSVPILLITGLMQYPSATVAVDAVMTQTEGPEAFVRNVAALLNRAPQDSRAA